MKLTRFYAGETIKPGVFIDDSTIVDCSGFGEDFGESFFGSDGLVRLAEFLGREQQGLPKFQMNEVRLAPAVARPSKIICIGLNYAQHAAETGSKLPTEPVLFSKATTAWSGPFDPVVIPKMSDRSDWEVELGVVIGKRAKYVTAETALDYVAGYGVHNDYSERQWQKERSGQWVKGKSADTFAPFGPYMATTDEVADPNNLRLWLKRNGTMQQDSSTSDFVFNVHHVISYISQFMTLLPGDVISTGTPAGVGQGMKPPQFLTDGDVIEAGIEGLGSQKQTAVKEK